MTTITRKSQLSGEINSMELDVTQAHGVIW